MISNSVFGKIIFHCQTIGQDGWGIADSGSCVHGAHNIAGTFKDNNLVVHKTFLHEGSREVKKVRIVPFMPDKHQRNY